MIPGRSLQVLRAIVEDYISSNQPVGSKSLLDRHPLGVSAATIRNDMALLEEEELITAPHTSSGRIPTEKGYRLFVDKLGDVKPLTASERRAIETFLDGANDLDDIVERTARTLSELTNNLALVQYPTLGKSRVRHVELIQVSDFKILVMLINDSGRVQQVQTDLPDSFEVELLPELRGRLNAVLSGASLSDVGVILDRLPNDFLPERRQFVQTVMATLKSMVDENRQEKLVLSGASKLAKQDEDFGGELSSVLEAIEEQVVMMRLMHEMQADQYSVHLRIGSELGVAGVSHATLMTAGYEATGVEAAKIGVLGPTRMNYSGNIASVRAVAKYLSNVLEANS
ncbi:MAG: heat-inducible transcriptional repressor HrcA [Aquiluna sp.]|nr:heat-inducible transcriptional repressor HrcA [Aquiluna sp.]